MVETIILLKTIIEFIAEKSECAANFILVFAFLRFMWSIRMRTLTIIDGEKVITVNMRSRDINAQSLTNAVSAALGGGMLSPEVRKQVIELTNPVHRVSIK